MATDFFERQDVARRNAGRLIILIILAILAMTATIHLIAAFVFKYPPSDWGALTTVFLATLLVVLGGSLYKIAQLRSGGRVIAEQLGGRLLSPDTSEATERRLLNVVEEMAIASGTPTPPVYLLDGEKGINAFAAGFSPEDAVIGVTRGTAEQLSRDELQGVIAHEFSHVLNGDMRLNIRLMGIVHGILIIGIIGYFLLRGAGGGRRREGSAPLLGLGLGLMVVGFIGTFFGNLIKAGVSRQREFLADASAVQFTRNPSGIGGALKKIGGFFVGSKIEHPNAPEASHMFFGQGISGFSALFATHPPLPDRIRRLEPSWDGQFPVVAEGLELPPPEPVAAGASGFASAAAGRVSAEAAAREAVDHVGQPTPAHIQYAAHLLEGLPRPVGAAVHEPYGARAVMYGLLIDRRDEPRRAQLERLAGHADRGVYAETIRLLPTIEQLDVAQRLPVISLAIPALRSLTPAQYDAFKQNVWELVRADEAIDVFEWSLQRILLHDLETQFGGARPSRVRYRSLKPLAAQCQVLLSTLAYVGHRSVDQAKAAFAQADQHLGLPQLEMEPQRERPDLDALGQALDALAEAAPRLKRQVLTACAVCITADRHVTTAEAELLRAISSALGCPMPPLL
ncbi:MAG: M48 family metallopeptidase [Anaerolineae bacterium]